MTCSSDHTIRVWELETGEQVSVGRLRTSEVRMSNGEVLEFISHAPPMSQMMTCTRCILGFMYMYICHAICVHENNIGSYYASWM